jgi:hypothetical protein
LKRTPWISWRLYFLTIPIDVVVIVVSSNQTITNLNQLLMWVILSLLVHASIAPLIFPLVSLSARFNSWAIDVAGLVFLGAIRGVIINVLVDPLGLEQRTGELYRVFNSTISLPIWFIGLAVFLESRRQYQKEFDSLFLRAARREQALSDENGLPVTEMPREKILSQLQIAATGLANEIRRVLDSPADQIDFKYQSERIQRLINEELRPASSHLWNGSSFSTPKLSLSALLRISLLEQRLRVILVALLSSPYLFIGLNGSQGLKLAAYETLFATVISIAIYLVLEGFFAKNILDRKAVNTAFIGLSFIVPLLAILFLIPPSLFWTDDFLTRFLYQLFLSSSQVVLLFGFNLYGLLRSQRSAVINNLEQFLKGEDLLEVSHGNMDSVRKIDLARYLHGEFQAGLTATSLLLERASKSGDAELARHALRSAVEILSRDPARASQERISAPRARLEKISSGWRGIAEVTIELDWVDELETPVLNDLISLIDEGVANSIRHAKASNISISGERVGADLNLQILSDGSAMTQNSAGLGTKLFNELASNWEYSKQGELNLLQFTIRSGV